jgi:Immunity protein 8
MMTTKLELKSIDSADVPLEIQVDEKNPFPGWSPPDPEFFGMQLTLLIGPSGTNKADNFQYYVCTRKFRDSSNEEIKRSIRFSRYEFMDRYDWPTLKKLLNDRVKSCEAATWEESLANLRKKFNWEFENFNMPSPRELH